MRTRPRQHVRKLKSGKKIVVNKGVRKKAKRSKPSTKIVRDEEWDEYQVYLFDDDGEVLPNATYHTDDKEDAEDTAKEMIKHYDKLSKKQKMTLDEIEGSDPDDYRGRSKVKKRPRKKVTLGDILEEAAEQGVITCPRCGNTIEPDGEECGDCGWRNPLVRFGLI